MTAEAAIDNNMAENTENNKENELMDFFHIHIPDQALFSSYK